MDPYTAFMIGLLLAFIQLSVSDIDLPFWYRVSYPALTGLIMAITEWWHNKKNQSSEQDEEVSE